MFDFLSATLRDYRADVRRRWWLVVVVAIGSVAAGVLPVINATDVYAGQVEVRNSYADREPIGSDPDDLNEQFLELGSDLVQVRSGSMRARVAEVLGTDLPTPLSVEATLVPFTTIVLIRVEAPTPDDARRVAQAYGEAFVDLRTEQILDPIEAAADRLEARVASAEAEIAAIDEDLADEATTERFRGSLRVRRAALVVDARVDRRDADALLLEAQTRAERIAITTDAFASADPVGQDPLRVGVLAGMLGLLVGTALAVGLGRFEAMRAAPPESPLGDDTP